MLQDLRVHGVEEFRVYRVVRLLVEGEGLSITAEAAFIRAICV